MGILASLGEKHRIIPALYGGYIFLMTGYAFAATPVTTQRYDNARSGQNQSETILNTSNVTSTTFGKIFTRTVTTRSTRSLSMFLT